MNKKFFLVLAIIVFTASVFSQSPKKLSYQAVIRNSSNDLVTSSKVGMQVSILQGSETGSAVYTETQTPTTNVNGLVSIGIGTGTTSDDFSTIDWANGPFYLKTESDPTGGSTYTITGVSQLLSVPYALHAKTAENISGTITETDPVYSASQAVNITANDMSNLGNLSGTNTGDQDLSDYATKDMANQKITNLGDPIDEQDAVTKAYVNTLISQLSNNVISLDIDGNTYSAVRIGTQVWMTENLKTTKYNDGTPIPLVTGGWDALTTPGYCWYGNDEATYAKTYGTIYNWHTVNTGNLCPAGWHVPTDAEWTTLTDHLGGEAIAGGELKRYGTVLWTPPNTGANNNTEFTALPGGYRNAAGTFLNLHDYGYWWSSTEQSATHAYYRSMSYSTSAVNNGNHNKKIGFSVRCIAD